MGIKTIVQQAKLPPEAGEGRAGGGGGGAPPRPPRAGGRPPPGNGRAGLGALGRGGGRGRGRGGGGGGAGGGGGGGESPAPCAPGAQLPSGMFYEALGALGGSRGRAGGCSSRVVGPVELWWGGGVGVGSQRAVLGQEGALLEGGE